MVWYAVAGMSGASALVEPLEGLAREGELCEPLPAGRVRCRACAHRCVIPPGRRGVCGVRVNRGGRLFVPWGYAAGVAVDPVEKKPFFHLLPGARVLTFGMLGCNLHCAYCQNWVTSQALRDPAAGRVVERLSPENLVAAARQCGARVVASSYNEPLITAEWAVAVFREAKAAGLRTAMVSNGYATPDVLDYLRPWCDALKVDLKTMRDSQYRRLGGRLGPVLDTVRRAHEMGFWVEVVTLVVPAFNDSKSELAEAAAFIASVDPDIPWHVTAFHPDYRMDDVPPTDAAALLEAARIGERGGLRFVYVGNVEPSLAGPYETTRCPGCREPLVERRGFQVVANRLGPSGACPRCGSRVPGLWA